jgi:hypothetical protein
MRGCAAAVVAAPASKKQKKSQGVSIRRALV